MSLFLFLLLVPIVVYGLRTAMGKSQEFTKLAKISRTVFISLALLFCVLPAIENINYYLVGYRSTSIVYLLVTIAGIVYVLSDRRFILSSVKRTLLNLIALVFMMGAGFLAAEMSEDFGKQLAYSDPRFRLEFTNRGLMAPCGLPALFVKSGIIERKSRVMTNDTCIFKADISSVTISDADSGYLVNYFLIDKAAGNKPFQLSVRYSKP